MIKTMGAKEPKAEPFVALAEEEEDDEDERRRDGGGFTISPQAAAEVGTAATAAAALLIPFHEVDGALLSAPATSASIATGHERLFRV